MSLVNIHLKVGATSLASVPAAQPSQLAKEVETLRQQLKEKEALLSSGGTTAKKAKKRGQENLIDTEPVQGCRDFPPEAMRTRNYLFNAFHRTARLFGFEEYDAPVLESEELYIRKAGEEITEQMFNFTTKGGHRVSLRPEMTPTLARLLLAKGRSLLLPVKWYSIPQCWRYENITRGRRREHYQWNMDIIGVKGSAAEAELICAICTTLESFGLTAKDVGIKISSRKILQTVLEKAGVTQEKFAPVCVIVDKLDKLPPEEVEAQLRDLQLDNSIIDVITNTLSLKSVEQIAHKIGSDHEAVADLKLFFDVVAAYGFEEWVVFDASVVRGLAYYTGIVFEAFDRACKFRAICGGGRYDQLLTTYGSSQSIACCGFGFGDCVIAELLEDKKLLPNTSQMIDDIIIPFDDSMRQNATRILRQLRSAGRVADIILEKKKLPQAYSYADRVGAQRAILVAPDEWAQGKVQVKMLREGPGKSQNQAGDRGFPMNIADVLK